MDVAIQKNSQPHSLIEQTQNQQASAHLFSYTHLSTSMHLVDSVKERIFEMEDRFKSSAPRNSE